MHEEAVGNIVRTSSDSDNPSSVIWIYQQCFISTANECICGFRMGYKSCVNGFFACNLKQYDEYMNILEGDVRYRPVFLTMLGVVPTMVDIWKGDEPITVQREYMSIMKKKGYHIFHYIRNNASLFGAAPSEGVPAVLTRPRFNLAAKRVVNELKILGDEFLKAVRLSSGSQTVVKA